MDRVAIDGVTSLRVVRDGRSVPTDLWSPAIGLPLGIVLACHGGSGHKRSGAIRSIVQKCLPLRLAVLAIDGPVHGDRRIDGDLTPKTAIREFREAWRAGVDREEIGLDFSAALDRLLADPLYTQLPVGYVGVSMGTAYGIPMLAREGRIVAAAIGLWSTNYVASSHLAALAQKIECPVWFTQQWNDEVFERQSTLELFDAIGSTNKCLVAYPGPHRELEGERLDDAITFLKRKLSAHSGSQRLVAAADSC